MSLAKLPLLLSGLITTYIIQTPPQARVLATERAKDVGLHERYLSTSARMNVEIIKRLIYEEDQSTKYWVTLDDHLTSLRKSAGNDAKKLARVFRSILDNDRASHGNNPAAINAVPEDEVVDERQQQVCTSIPLLVEAAVILGNRFPSHAVSRWILRVFARNKPGFVQRLVLSPTFLAACAIGVAGGALRYRCYRTLGRFFTLELAVHKGHKLVTEGPYRYVRHPSYTAWSLGSVGVGLMSVTRGSWLRESGLLETQWGRMAFAFCTLYILYGTVGLTVRAPTEDEMLRREFGEEWEAYARRVPYRLVPYVF
ncbi:uncharacterized protein B0H18DRAFT_1119938 [Fomitopsis serialis]|uniref:uncharacterized protein n=1 Tax=Fomitopsis serialis TaxID=139415 RepID=UPI002008A556|nr:uncharacterized protein B0H18DRAFT_1119938 [Neoantrodia serialis]KAH9924401.1 hypothetical protein B0H18DRAFT_1119938 [Neoantrodia serialis]